MTKRGGLSTRSCFYVMRDLAPLANFLGLEIEMLLIKGSNTMDPLKATNLTNGKRVDTPIEGNVNIEKMMGKSL